MKQLPVGVYAVSNLYTTEGVFHFRDELYQAQLGVTGFYNFEELVKQPLVPVEEPFLGHENVPVILVPRGVIPIGEVGKTNAERFRVVFPRAVAILGENMGIPASHHEMVEERKRQYFLGRRYISYHRKNNVGRWR